MQGPRAPNASLFVRPWDIYFPTLRADNAMCVLLAGEVWVGGYKREYESRNVADTMGETG